MEIFVLWLGPGSWSRQDPDGHLSSGFLKVLFSNPSSDSLLVWDELLFLVSSQRSFPWSETSLVRSSDFTRHYSSVTVQHCWIFNFYISWNSSLNVPISLYLYWRDLSTGPLYPFRWFLSYFSPFLYCKCTPLNFIIITDRYIPFFAFLIFSFLPEINPKPFSPNLVPRLPIINNNFYKTKSINQYSYIIKIVV